MEVAVTLNIDPDLLKKCSEIIGLDVKVDENADSEIQIVLSEAKINERTKMVQTVSAGVDHLNFINFRNDIVLCCNAGAFSYSVAEHTFALLLSRIKKIREFDSSTRKGEFKKERVGTLYGKTIGILGYGGIGRQIARIAKAFNMNVIGFTRSPKDDENTDRFAESIEETMKSSDILVIALPLTKKTENILDRKYLDNFRGNIIVNIGRADVVKKNDMLNYLKDNPEKSYLTDVWWGEPKIEDKIPDNVILTPHIAGISEDQFEFAVLNACRNVRKYLDKKPENVIDISEYAQRKSENAF